MEKRIVKAKNGKIEFLRFLFSVIIVIHHTRTLFGDDKCKFLGGSFAVEFFFLVSGFLMMASIDKVNARESTGAHLGKETLQFLSRKAKAVCPDIFVAYFIALIFVTIAKHGTLLNGAVLFVDSFFEVTLLKMTGLPAISINGVLWYISSMLLCMAVLYPLIRKYSDMMIHIGVPLIALLTLGYLGGEYNDPRNPLQWIGFTHKGNLRAMGEICLGVICYFGCRKIKNLRLSTLGKTMVSVVEWGFYAIVILYMYFEKATDRDYFFLILLAVAVTLSFSHQGVGSALFDNRFAMFLGKLSLPMYLSHTFFAQNLNKVLPVSMTDDRRMAVYLLCTAVTSFVVWGISAGLRKAWPGIRKYSQRLFLAN